MTQRALRVLQVVASLQGGAARHVLHLSEGLIENDHAVTVAAPNDDPSMAHFLARAGAERVDFPDLGWPGWRFWTRWSALMRRGFDVVHVHGHRGAILPRLARRLGVKTPPVVYSVHGYHPPFYRHATARWRVNGLERWLAASTDAFICVSESTQQALVQAAPQTQDRAVVVHNGLPAMPRGERLTREQARDLFGFREEQIVVGCVARLHWQKGLDRLIEGFAQWGNPEALLWLVGNGPEEDALRALADRLGIAGQVRFAGGQADARRTYPAMDVFVLPSLWEGLPLTVLEAWDAGTPVIATDVPGNRGLVTHGQTGWLAHSSATGVADALAAFFAQGPAKHESVIQQAQERLEQSFRVERMVNSIEEVYRRLVESGPSS